MPARFTILGSGSSGNCSYIEDEETRILIDAGFSGRQIRERLGSISRAPESLDGILITHEHVDHIQGLPAIGGKCDIPIYCNRFTREAIEHQFPDARFSFCLFETGATLTIGSMEIQTFAVPHDAMDPVGFLVQTTEGNIGLVTDLGHVTRLVMERIRASDILVLEANHDVKMLQEDTRRPWSTKQRILGRHGHLSNEAAANTALEIASDRLRQIYLGHLSRDCNRPELAHDTVHRRLTEAGATHIRVETAAQDRPSATCDLTATLASPVSG